MKGKTRVGTQNGAKQTKTDAGPKMVQKWVKIDAGTQNGAKVMVDTQNGAKIGDNRCWHAKRFQCEQKQMQARKTMHAMQMKKQ